MGRSLSLFLVRASSILIGGMLMFAVFTHARAENLDGYGLKPMVAGPDDGNYGLGPVPPPMKGDVHAPAPPAAAPALRQQVAATGYAPGPSAPYQPAAPYAPPQPPLAPYGYKPDAGRAEPVYPQAPVYPSAANPPPAAYAYYQPNVPAPSRANPDYVLGTGDKVKLTVFGETDLSGEFAIDGSGNLALPLVGQVRAAGYTAAQLESAVGDALSRGYLKSPRVSVEVSTYRPFYIIGAVNRPGQYPYVDHMNAMNAIALAGGFTPTAVESVVFLRREASNQEVEVPVDRTTEIRPGDVIKVHNTVFSDITNWISPISGVAASAATAAIIQ